MRFDNQKGFPYPVLRPDINDYVDGGFQVTVEMHGSETDAKLTASIQVALSVEEISEQVAKGSAVYLIVFSCRDTYFRRSISSKVKDFIATFDSGDFRGEVVIYPFVVARKSIQSFACKDINPEFRKKKFDFSVGDVLAADEPKVLYIDRDLFKPITSVFELVKQDSLSGFEWRLSFDQDKVQIQVSSQAKEVIDRARNSTPHRAVLINSLYFCAVMEAIQRLKDGEEMYVDYRWAKVLKQQCHNAAIDFEVHETHWIAQRLLRTPLTLLNEYVFKGD